MIATRTLPNRFTVAVETVVASFVCIACVTTGGSCAAICCGAAVVLTCVVVGLFVAIVVLEDGLVGVEATLA